MSNSSMVSHVNLSPNFSSRNGRKITKITPHHVSGVTSVETLGNIFKPTARQASSNYGIGNDGRVGLYVDEGNRAWTSSSYENDSRAVTIEVSNSSMGGDWPVSEAAWNTLVNLCVDICKRNGIPKLVWTGGPDGTLTMHKMFANTDCPGPYLERRMPELAKQVNAILAGTQKAPTTPTAPSTPSTNKPTNASGYNIWMQAMSAGGKVWPVVHNNNDNAGVDAPMTYLSAWTNPGTLKCQARTEKGGWLPELINPSDIGDLVNGAIGDGSPITGIRMYYNSPNGDKAVHYRVKTEGSGWLPWMIDHKDTGGSKDNFAGNGKRIQRIEAYIGGLS